MEKTKIIRTALFVPGNRPERVDKAVKTDADAIIIDLEDAVPHTLKRETRSVVCEKILQHNNREIFVRVNPLDSEYFHGDLDEVITPGLSGLITPKVEKPKDIIEIYRIISEIEQKKGLEPGWIKVIPLIESALALENVFPILSEKGDPDRLLTAAFGAADFALDMSITITKSGEELAYARARIAIACRAVKIAPPLDTPFMIDLKDLQALEAEAMRAKQLGFQGKLCIHPNQIEICNRIFSPTEEEIAFAQKVVEAFDQAEESGQAAILVDDKLIDYPMVEHARRILKAAVNKET